MKIKNFFIYVKFFTFIFLSLFASSVFSKTLSKRTLSRTLDPVIISGYNLQKMFNLNIANLFLYAYSSGQFKTIPFQIDEKDDENNFIYPQQTNTINDAETLDSHDELVFMSSDCGDKISKEEIKKNFDDILEIEVYDQETNDKCWVYLLYFKNKNPALSSFDYVNYFPQEEKVTTSDYEVKFSQDSPIYYDFLLLKTNKDKDLNFADRLKIHFYVKTKLGLTASKNEDDFNTQTVGYIDGPVRVIRKQDSTLTLFGLVTSPTAISEAIFYSNQFSLPFTMSFNFDPGALIDKATLRVTAESSPFVNKKFYNEKNYSGVLIDGKMSEEEKILDLSSYNWGIIVGADKDNSAGFLNRLILSNNFNDTPKLFYMDDDSIPEEPENYPGQFGNIGYIIEGFAGIKKGEYTFTSFLYYVPDYRKGEEKQYLQILDNPLQFNVDLMFSAGN